MTTRLAMRTPDLIESRFVFQRYALEVDADSGVTLADLMSPPTWNGASKLLKPGDTIRCTKQGKGSFDLTLVVKSVMVGLGASMGIFLEDSGPGTPLGRRLAQAEAAVRSEERAALMASLGINNAGGQR
jgi:hypothetical protein